MRLPDFTKMMYDQAAMPLAVVSPRTGSMPAVRALGTVLLVGCLAGLLAACGSSSRGGGGSGVAQRGAYKVGAPYKIDGVTGVTCPAEQKVEDGAKFECTATIAGKPQKVPITVKGDGGNYEVSPPVAK